MHLLIYYNMGSKSAIGIGNGICFKQVRDKGGGSYIDPLVRDSIVGLWKSDQNTNESPTRNIIKNAIKDKGGDLELLNFGYKLNSGYGGYIEDFSLFTLSNRFEYSEISNTKVTITAVLDNSTGIYHSVTEEDSALYWNTFKIKVSGSTDDVYISYITNSKNIRLYNGINTVVTPNDLSWHSFTASATNVSCNITLEFVPEYEGALVTDGKDDMIVSQKTVQEMLGGSKEITVVSMIHQIGRVATNTNLFTNCIQYNTGSKGHNIVNYQTSLGKTGIYGYSRANVSVANNEVVINNILGDKADYLTNVSVGALTSNEKFSVVGYLDVSPQQVTSVAVYWTFISNKVLTTDEINQIIAYFKLDKYVTPQVIYDVKRQGLTNDTPAADWYLKDFSGNGHDMQLYNYAKELGSGIGKYEVDFNTWIPQSYVADSAYTSNKLHITNIKGGNAILYTNKGANAMKVKITGIQSFNLVYRYIAENDVWEALEVDRDGIYELPASTTTTKTYYTGFTVPYYTGDCDITIKQIPDYEGALVSDGINDYGKVENLPIYKDYTVVADREIIDGLAENADGGVALKGESTIANSFIFDFNNEVYSFAKGNSKTVDTERFISYQSKYVNNGVNIDVGTGDDTDVLYLAKLGKSDRYSKLAFWSFLLFPYTLSEFLLERQLKRYKLGTLYPDMIEWRPIAKSNIPYKQIDYFIKRSGAYVRLNPGDYFQSTEDIIVRVTPIRDWQLDVVSSIKVNGKNEVISVNSSYAQTAPIHIDKSPQKIDITIDEYIRFEDIIQPYPAIVNLSQDGKSITWGDKLKVGSEVTFVNHTNLLPDLYTVSGGVQYNGTSISWNTSIRVEKSMVFVNPHSYKKANEPSCILSPNRLRIPNSSYKILGYIPDLTGKGNHGRLNNFAYTEESGANEDGSIRFDGTDDHIIIPTIKHGGKALLMKVNWRYKNNIAMVYDQRINWGGLGISISQDQLPLVAYKPYNKVTYIDGIRNESVLVQDLEGITHNITGIYDNLNLSDERDVCISRTSDASNSGFADMSMYEFMLFPDVPNEEEIKELNDIVGIEGGYVERPEYYWDVYGKTNSDADRATIIDQVSKEPVNALIANNFAFNEESGYVDNGLVSDGVDDNLKNTNMPVLTDYTWIMKRKRLNDKSSTTLCHKGNGSNTNAFLFEVIENTTKTRSFGTDSTVVFPDLISWQTKNSYNGQTIASGTSVDGNVLHIFMGSNVYPYYTKAVFYKAMLYSKTINMLSINMLKNLFEKDGLIDVNNPIFKKEEL